jgi:hypothetical protein
MLLVPMVGFRFPSSKQALPKIGNHFFQKKIGPHEIFFESGGATVVFIDVYLYPNITFQQAAA